MYDYSMLVGANNSGKSNIVQALRIFYEDASWAISDGPRIVGADGDSWIELQYALSADEFASLPDKYKGKDHILRVRKYLVSDEKDRVTKGQSNIYAYLPDGSLEETLFFGAKNIGQAKLGKIIYVPALSTTGDTFKMTGPSPFRSIITFLLKKVLESSKGYAQVGEAFKVLDKEANGKDGFLTQLCGPMNGALQRWGINMVLGIKALAPEDIVKNHIEHSFHDQAIEDALPIDRFGHGFQRTVIYELIKLAPRFADVKKPAKKEFDPDFTLILFEEPETFLHPDQQEHMSVSLRQLGAQGGQQVLVTTHSPIFVGKAADDLKQIVRLVRQSGSTRVFQPSPTALTEILTGAQKLRDALAAFVNDPNIADAKKGRARTLIANFPTEDVAAQEDSFRFQLFLDGDRASIFFADTVIICEGVSEKALFNYMLQNKWSDLRTNSIFVLDALGKYNFPRYLLLLEAFGVRHGVLLDADANKNEHQAINDLVHSLCCGASTNGIHQFDDDLEAFLGLPKTDRPDKKAIEILKVLSADAIPGATLDTLRAIFGKLCGEQAAQETEEAPAVAAVNELIATVSEAAEVDVPRPRPVGRARRRAEEAVQ